MATFRHVLILGPRPTIAAVRDGTATRFRRRSPFKQANPRRVPIPLPPKPTRQRVRCPRRDYASATA